MKLRVTYLLEDTALFGGVKVVLHQANLLARRGHEVLVVSKGPLPRWYSLEAGFRQVDQFSAGTLPRADVTVATFWTTLEAAARAAPGEVVHLCQGFEGALIHNRPEHSLIRQAYRRPLPALTVGPHLSWLLSSRFGRPSRVVRQSLEDFWRQPVHRREGPGEIPRILVTSPFEFYVKGVAVALSAVRRLRNAGMKCSLVRLSQWPAGDEEAAMLAAEEFHQALEPPQVAELLRGCDLLLAPSWPQEGFGLLALEAMACGLPAVVSDIPAFQSFAAGASRLVRFDSAEAFAFAAREVLESPERWREMRAAGLEVASRFTEEAATEILERALLWVASGAWRKELRSSVVSKGDR